MDHHHYDQIIIGGGVAGLACLNRLADLGAPSLLIDGGQYPSHKVCGEFFSPECLPILEEWDLLPSTELTHARFFSKGDTFSFPFDTKPRTNSRYCFDAALAKLATSKGATILTNTLVSAIDRKGSLYVITADNGSTYTCSSLVIGTGRVLSSLHPRKTTQTKYIGFKAHFDQVSNIDAVLEMHSLPGAYIGISPIEEGKTNVGGVVLKALVDKEGGFTPFIQSQKGLFDRLHGANMLFPDWMRVAIPHFRQEPFPTLSNVYLIGDAAATIHPICGDGLAMGICSGYRSASYILDKNWQEFAAHQKKSVRFRLYWGRCLHQIMLRPHLSHLLGQCCSFFPSLFSTIYQRTRN